jgi:hypothetical protein
MKHVPAVLISAFLLPCSLYGQGTTTEIGTGLGVNIFSNGGTVTSVGIPGPGVGALGLITSAPVYASFFFSGGAMIQPELAFRLISADGEELTTIATVANVGYLFGRPDENALYLTANGAWQYADVEGDSEDEFGAGGRVGYRIVVNQGFAVSLEGGYRRWFDSEANEIVFGLRLGGVF